jgi:hypothetical protein
MPAMKDFAHKSTSLTEFKREALTICDSAFISNVEEATRQQSLSSEWFRQRTGRITSSLFGYIASYKANKPNNYIVKKVMESSNFTSVHTEYGIAQEPVARQLYILRVLSEHSMGKCVETGLNISAEYPWLAASPDGLITCKCCGNGCLEIKSPSTRRDMSAQEIADKGDYELELNAEGEPTLKRTSKWFHQIQGQMFVCQRVFCDFVLYTKKDIFVERIYLCDEWLNSVLPKILRFYDEFIYPCLAD